MLWCMVSIYIPKRFRIIIVSHFYYAVNYFYEIITN